MEKTSELIGNIYESANEYAHLQAKSAKLEIYERITNLIASGISASFIIVFGLFSFIFINIGVAYWLSEVMHSNKLGFLSLGGFYFVVLGLYLLFRRKVAHNKVKNIVLLKVSKDMDDYELMMKDQDIVHAQVKAAEETMKANFEELKNNLQTLKDDFSNIKKSIAGDSHHEENNHVGPKLPRIAITSAVDFVLQNLVFKKAGFLKRTILPIIANALVTSTVFKEEKKTSLVENLKLKASKLF